MLAPVVGSRQCIQTPSPGSLRRNSLSPYSRRSSGLNETPLLSTFKALQRMFPFVSIRTAQLPDLNSNVFWYGTITLSVLLYAPINCLPPIVVSSLGISFFHIICPVSALI